MRFLLISMLPAPGNIQYIMTGSSPESAAGMVNFNQFNQSTPIAVAYLVLMLLLSLYVTLSFHHSMVYIYTLYCSIYTCRSNSPFHAAPSVVCPIHIIICKTLGWTSTRLMSEDPHCGPQSLNRINQSNHQNIRQTVCVDH